MTSARWGDIAQNGNYLAAQVGEVANTGVVAPGDYSLEGALVTGTEPEMSIAALMDRDAKDLPCDAPMFADQL
jgi:hypothetical protein